MKRRTVLKGTLGISTAMIAAGAGFLSPQSVLAAWPRSAFTAQTVEDAVRNSMGSSSMSEDRTSIIIKAPVIAENGASVGITVSSTLPKVDSMSILVKKNPSPLAGNFVLRGANAFIRTRIKVSKSSEVIVVARSNGKLYTAKHVVKVTIGGCGG